MYAMTKEDYIAIRESRFTLVTFQHDGKRVSTCGGLPAHELVGEITAATKQGLICKVWPENQRPAKPYANSLSDFE